LLNILYITDDDDGKIDFSSHLQQTSDLRQIRDLWLKTKMASALTPGVVRFAETLRGLKSTPVAVAYLCLVPLSIGWQRSTKPRSLRKVSSAWGLISKNWHNHHEENSPISWIIDYQFCFLPFPSSFGEMVFRFNL